MKHVILTLLTALCCIMAEAQHTVTPLNPESVLPEAQWRGRWIGIDRLLPGEDMTNKTRVNARYLRKEYRLQHKSIKRARAYIATMGYYELHINGKRIGTEVLTPQQTDFRKSIYYTIHDITSAMEGDSVICIGVILGNGRTVPMRYLKHYKCPFL
ncbi:MAG: alpha-L-rhamnosidase N-terminal domain-containing protein, partial [Prevotellaceae bacterium]|nr:alpha-L-rhamnosidase N-terminal domain-containing protein [Prevotellaceae bacterium]